MTSRLWLGSSGLERLDLGGTRIGDAMPLARLHNLRSLDLSGTLISDVTPLAGLTGLQFLDLTNTPVTDLAPLGALKSLRWLNLRSTQADLSVLSRLPGCRVITSVMRRRS